MQQNADNFMRYDEFVDKVNEAGFRSRYTNVIDPDIFKSGTTTSQCYTGDPETDSGKWGLRAAQEKKLAYGYFFNGEPDGFISPHFFSVFVDAFRPRMSIEERYESGRLGAYEWMVWIAISGINAPVCWPDIYKFHGINDAAGRRKLDVALKNLQMSFDISVSHAVEDVLKNGEPALYKDGSPIINIGYSKTDEWVPSKWMAMNPRMGHKEALDVIYRQAGMYAEKDDARKAFRKSKELIRKYIGDV